MKIVSKLILLIAIGVLGCISIGSIGFSRLADLNADMRNVMDNTLPSFNTLSATQVRFLELRLLLRAHALTDNISEKEALEPKIKAKETQLVDGLKQYETLISDDKDRAMYQQVTSDIQSYIDQSEITLKFSRANDRVNAIQELSKLASISSNASESLADGIKYNETLARNADEINTSNYDAAKWFLTLTALLATALLAVIGWLIYQQISRGLNQAQTTIKRIESSLDFTLRADAAGQDEISDMLRAFNQLIGRLQTNLREILQGVEQVSSNASQLQSSAHKVSEGSNSQNTSSSHMAASVEEMTVSINHVADQARETNEQSQEVGKRAEAGQKVIQHAVENIHAIADAVDNAAKDIRQLEDKSKEIESVINIIGAVAEQTNLLALNAAIEAARAGEQGRGFAVVADEVRSLAARTATSTKEISDMIMAIQGVSGSAVKRMQDAIQKVEQGVSGANQANATMEDIFDVASRSVALVSDISGAIREQGAATNAIAQQVENVASMVEENSRAANETTSLANDLARVSQQMKQIVTAYQL